MIGETGSSTPTPTTPPLGWSGWAAVCRTTSSEAIEAIRKNLESEAERFNDMEIGEEKGWSELFLSGDDDYECVQRPVSRKWSPDSEAVIFEFIQEFVQKEEAVKRNKLAAETVTSTETLDSSPNYQNDGNGNCSLFRRSSALESPASATDVGNMDVMQPVSEISVRVSRLQENDKLEFCREAVPVDNSNGNEDAEDLTDDDDYDTRTRRHYHPYPKMKDAWSLQEELTKERAQDAMKAVVSPTKASVIIKFEKSVDPIDIIKKLTDCTDCLPRKKFSSRLKAANHIKRKHGKGFCPGCFKPYPQDTLISHLKENHFISIWNEKIACAVCLQDFSHHRLMNHLHKEHLMPVENNERQLLREFHKEELHRSSRSIRKVETHASTHTERSMDVKQT